jgi:hypothetical protein
MLRVYSNEREWLLDVNPDAYDAVLHCDCYYDSRLHHSKPLPEGALPLPSIRVHYKVPGRGRLSPQVKLDFRIFKIENLGSIRVFRTLFVDEATKYLVDKFEDTDVEVLEALFPALLNYREYTNFDADEPSRRPVIEHYLNAVAPLIRVKKVPGRALPADPKERLKVLLDVLDREGPSGVGKLLREPTPWAALKALGVILDVNGSLHVLVRQLSDGGWAAIWGIRVVADRVPAPAVPPLEGGKCQLYGIARIKEVVFKQSEDGFGAGGFARVDFVAVYPHCARKLRVRAHRVRRE